MILSKWLNSSGSNGNEWLLHTPQTPWPEPYYQTQFIVIPRTLIGGGCLTPLQRCSWCILQPQSIEQFNTFVLYILPVIFYIIDWWNLLLTAQSAGAVEYTDCTSAELGLDPPPTTNQCPGYGNNQSDGEVPVMLELWGMRSTPSLPSLSGPPLARVGRTW